ncbi:hypothetical protein [Flavobacterium luminosum]|uniref:TonB-dependent receptor plug domain-containing protein n=1 Tax=Flavobacterium luminosum TaxID=2949086 RepID=A0ABT0TKF4_9FLAO|nr:hypothetical protein [Flavobacterium sp. HXWNR70]MCL9807977.1 hypothetical protein [Flavobacterium sp. HXWNR70]
MDRLKLIFNIIISLATQHFVFAQDSISPNEITTIDRQINETVFVSINNTAFITGETIFYKIYSLDKEHISKSDLSKIVYIELVNENKESVMKQKVFLDNGSGSGDFFIPTTWETGNYKLIAYTNWMLNFKSDYFANDITIYNPYKPSNKAINTSLDTLANKTTENNSEEITIKLNKTEFSHREAVNVTFDIQNKKLKEGNFSISVRKKDNLEQNSNWNPLTFVSSRKNTPSVVENLSSIHLPELRGEIIQGKITPKNTNLSVEGKNIALSIPGNSFAFKITKTDRNGNFIFLLDKPYENSNIIIQLVGNDLYDYTIEVTKQKNFDYSQLVFPNNLSFNSAMKESLEQRLIASQIENAYYSVKKDSIMPSNYNKPFYDHLAKEYILDNYTRFSSIKETIIEIIPRIYFKQQENKSYIYLDDYNEGNELPMPSLVLVDGLYISDINELFSYDPKNIQKIEVVYGGYQYGTMLFNGIVSFTTKSFDYESKLKGDFIIKPEVLRPIPQKEYYFPNYLQAKNLNRIPDFRHQLLWIPQIDLKKEINFFTSDVSGNFEIRIEGFSSMGTPVLVTKTFNVN